MKHFKLYLNIILLIFVFSCSLEPKFEKPKSEAPLSKSQLPEITYEKFFLSEEVKRIIELALKNNKDIALSKLNVEYFEKLYGISKADLMPQLYANGTYFKTNATIPARPEYSVGFNASYELDFFGKVRSLKNASLARFLSEQENLKSANIIVINKVLIAYLSFIIQSEMLEMSDEMLKASIQKAEIGKIKFKRGFISSEDNLLYQSSVEFYRQQHLTTLKNLEEGKRNLKSLLGVNFDTTTLIGKIENKLFVEELLHNVPSEVLLERPDIKKIEYEIQQSNANIGALRAAFFPSIQLIGTYGYASNELSGLFQGANGVNPIYTFVPQINLPIFTGFRNKRSLDAEKIRNNALIIQYEQAVENAFLEVLNLLENKKILNARLQSVKRNFELNEELNQISQKKFDKGQETSEDRINKQQSAFMAKQEYMLAQFEYYTNIINLLKAFYVS